MTAFTWLQFGESGPLLALGYGLFIGLMALGFVSLHWQRCALAAKRKQLEALKAQMKAG